MRTWLLILVVATVVTGGVAVHLVTRAPEPAPPLEDGPANAPPEQQTTTLPGTDAVRSTVPVGLEPGIVPDVDEPSETPPGDDGGSDDDAPPADGSDDETPPADDTGGDAGTGSGDGGGGDGGGTSGGDGSGDGGGTGGSGGGSGGGGSGGTSGGGGSQSRPPILYSRSYSFTPGVEDSDVDSISIPRGYKHLWFNVTFMPGAFLGVGASADAKVTLVDPSLQDAFVDEASAAALTSPETHRDTLDDPAEGTWRVEYVGSGSMRAMVTVVVR